MADVPVPQRALVTLVAFCAAVPWDELVQPVRDPAELGENALQDITLAVGTDPLSGRLGHTHSTPLCVAMIPPVGFSYPRSQNTP